MNYKKLKNWPDKVKLMQKNWIGKSYGCEINFQIDKEKKLNKIKVFTTRPDTIFGASFIALSLDHPISKILKKIMILNPLNQNVQKWELRKKL